MTSIGTCRLCLGQNVELQDSHILPKAAYRRIRPPPGGPIASPIMVADGVARFTDRQLTEQLLCSACEQRIGQRERAFLEVCAQEDGSFPAADLVPPLPPTARGLQEADGSALPVNDLVYFVLSVLWRSSEARVAPDVALGRYGDPVRKFLLGEARFPDAVYLGVVVVLPTAEKARIDRLITLPYVARRRPFHMYVFQFLGFFFLVSVGRGVPARVRELCIFTNPRRPVITSDGDAVRDLVGPAFIDATPKGKLAQLRENGGP